MAHSLGMKDTKVRDDTSMKPEIKEKIKNGLRTKKLTGILRG
tara:strand:+ start:1218 stop:1343 length:126 start_codon:yes stop_codon:yes gene_type:complete